MLALLLGASCALAALGGNAPARNGQLDRVQSKRDAVSESIDRGNREVNDLIAQLSELHGREATLRRQEREKEAELERATARLAKERDHFDEVRARLKRAKAVLGDRLVAIYKSPQPDVLTVVLRAATWSEVQAQVEYLDRIEQSDKAVVDRVRLLRDQTRQAVRKLTATREEIANARDAIAAQQDQLDSTRSTLRARRSNLIAARARRKRALQSLNLEEQALKGNLSGPLSGTQNVPSSPGKAGVSGGRAVPPPNAPGTVRAVIEAANRIADKPYLWGGGHGSFEAAGYDCSGAISYALHGGGLLSQPLDSGGFASWGEPGFGRWITVYSSPGHAFAVIAGLRWDTGGNGGGAGPRWHADLRPVGGYVARHPNGL